MSLMWLRERPGLAVVVLLVGVWSRTATGFRRPCVLRPALSTAAATAALLPALHPEDFSRNVISSLLRSPLARRLGALLPPPLQALWNAVFPGQLVFALLLHFTHTPLLRYAHSWQAQLCRWLRVPPPADWKDSLLGLLDRECKSISRVVAGLYLFRLLLLGLDQLGMSLVPTAMYDLAARILYVYLAAKFLDSCKSQFLTTMFPWVAKSRRQSYVLNRSGSVLIAFVSALIVLEMISAFLKVPLSSTLAFGGIGGLAAGLSARDLGANFLGGILLLFNEPFTPGDMIALRSGGVDVVGKVERVGWAQTRLRGRDTRPTYVPNSHFAQTAVTNLDRITHRKFETSVSLRFQDFDALPAIVDAIRDRLRAMAKIDTFAMPFRVHFARFGAYSLDVDVLCYFKVKTLDEFLDLQQMANFDILHVVKSFGAELALPTRLLVEAQRRDDAAAAAADTERVAPPPPDAVVAPQSNGDDVRQDFATAPPPVDPGRPPPVAKTSDAAAAAGPAAFRLQRSAYQLPPYYRSRLSYFDAPLGDDEDSDGVEYEV